MEPLISRLKEIPAKYKPIPFWSWNDQLEESELRRQIRWMHDNGIGGFFMHARGGLKTPYLSGEWMELVEACCDEAKELGMDAWVYDENGWPSGFAGGKLLEDVSNRDMYILHAIGKYDPLATVSYNLDGAGLVRIREANRCGEQNLNLYLRISASTADILNPKVVDRFLEETHEKYKAHFGNAFSDKVTGFFTDEPQYYRAATPYTPMVADWFRDTYQEDILDSLGLLFVEKEGYQAFRYRYWVAMQHLMLENFSQKIYGWCCDNGVKLTGHYVEETTMGAQIMCCAGVMPFYEYEHIPGIDWLGRDTNNELSPRQLGSAAQQLGKKQMLTETFGCCGWNVSPADLKRIAGFQYACGVNLMCHHLLPYSEHGQRKRDYPAHFGPLNPWITEHFKDFNDYFSRLGYLLSESREPVNVAVLHPIRSAYFHYKRENNSGDFPFSELDNDLQKTCRMLSSRAIAYHFLDETLLEKHGFVDHDRIGCGQCAYQYLVIPKILTMGIHTEKLIHKFVDNGGKVLLVDEAPTYLEGSPFCYDYLTSNCTLSEIMAAQPISVQNYDTQLYCTYRIFEGKPFLFVQNASDTQRYTQMFSFCSGARSFVALDPVTLTICKLPLTVTLEKNESRLLFLSDDPVPEPEPRKTVALSLSDSFVSFPYNCFTLDAVRYSKDGIHFSKPILCCDLRKELLSQRYDGQIWLRYDFLVEKCPNSLLLLTEKGNTSQSKVNNVPVVFGETLKEEPCVQYADISALVCQGINTYETVLYWHQSEETYYALFGEGVTESLRNCIAYDSEIEAVYLAGTFGVYSRRGFQDFGEEYLLGSDFYIGDAPKKITEPVTDGLPFFRGELTLSKQVALDDPNVQISLCGDYLMAKVFVNGENAGEICFNTVLDISPWAKQGMNEIKAVFTIGNRNLLGPFHAREDESFVDPAIFERNNIPSEDGTLYYKFHRFFSKKYDQIKEAL